MGFIFEPQNEEEKLWRAYSRINDKAFTDNMTSEILFYANGRLRIKKDIAVPLCPINSIRRFTYRSIIYSFRVFSDEELDNKISFTKVWASHVQGIERTKRAIYKYWSCHSELIESVHFETCRLLIENIQGRHIPSFIQTMTWLMAWGIVDIYRKSEFSNSMTHFKLTEFGKIIVKMHRDEHLVF